VVERDLANSLLINTFSNLDRLQGTAKYLKTHERQVSQRVLMRVRRKSASRTPGNKLRRVTLQRKCKRGWKAKAHATRADTCVRIESSKMSGDSAAIHV
jgi:hypothetical protein